MSDISNVFKATIKSIKSRNKNLNKDPLKDEKSSILPSTKHRGQFETNAREVVLSITKLRDFLLMHRKDYLNAGSHLSGDISQMTDTERDQIDFEAQNIIKKCQDSLNTIQKSAGKDFVKASDWYVKVHKKILKGGNRCTKTRSSHSFNIISDII